MVLTVVAMNLQRPSKRYMRREKGNDLAFSHFAGIKIMLISLNFARFSLSLQEI